MVVDEGGSVVIGRSVIDMTSLSERLSSLVSSDKVDVSCVVVDAPQHGSLMVAGDSASVNTEVTQQQIDEQQVLFSLRYIFISFNVCNIIGYYGRKFSVSWALELLFLKMGAMEAGKV